MHASICVHTPSTHLVLCISEHARLTHICAVSYSTHTHTHFAYEFSIFPLIRRCVRPPSIRPSSRVRGKNTRDTKTILFAASRRISVFVCVFVCMCTCICRAYMRGCVCICSLGLSFICHRRRCCASTSTLYGKPSSRNERRQRTAIYTKCDDDDE